MTCKLCIILACVAVTGAALLPVAQQSGQRLEEYDSHPSYSFSYEVQDQESGDIKSQSETRDGDVVQGQYSLQDADGFQRIVEYSVNGESGFNAVVRREPLSGVSRAPQPQPQATPALVAAPAPAPAPVPVAKSPVLKPIAAPVRPLKLQAAYVQPATYIRTAYAPTHHVLHHAPATVIHSAAPVPSVHLSHSPTVFSHHVPAVVRTSLSTPHYQYVY